MDNKLWCDCKVCQSWNGKVIGTWACLKNSCACGDKVLLVTQMVNDTISAKYVCADYEGDGYYCGFNVNVLEDFRKYKFVMDGVAYYIYYILNREKCKCRKQTRAVLKCVTTTCEPIYLRNISLDNELQLFYVCNNDTCDYENSVPQIVKKRYDIKCLCCKVCNYYKGVYYCMRENGGCGVCFHELDSLTFMHTIITNEKYDYISPFAPFAHYKSVIKYVLNELEITGQLLYRCRVKDDCLLVKNMHGQQCAIP
jgi:hypothetical protein